MMDLWILRPIKGRKEWNSGYDRSYGFIVQAEDEDTARDLAYVESGDEGGRAWLDSGCSTCKRLVPGIVAKIIMRDYAAA